MGPKLYSNFYGPCSTCKRFASSALAELGMRSGAGGEGGGGGKVVLHDWALVMFVLGIFLVVLSGHSCECPNCLCGVSECWF